MEERRALLTTYSDDPTSSPTDYGRELATARAAWPSKSSGSATIRPSASAPGCPRSAKPRCSARSAGAARSAGDRDGPKPWARCSTRRLTTIEQLVLTGNLRWPSRLLDALVGRRRTDGPFADAARAGLDRLRSGPLMKHVVLFIRQARTSGPAGDFGVLPALGPDGDRPLAEALAASRGGRQAVARRAPQLRRRRPPTPTNCGRRRIPPCGGRHRLAARVRWRRCAAGPQGAARDDAEPAVQRDALRAIVQIGTDEAYARSRGALKATGEARATRSCRSSCRRATSARPRSSSTSSSTQRSSRRARGGLSLGHRGAGQGRRRSLGRRADEGAVSRRVVGAAADQATPCGRGDGLRASARPARSRRSRRPCSEGRAGAAGAARRR